MSADETIRDHLEQEPENAPETTPDSIGEPTAANEPGAGPDTASEDEAPAPSFNPGGEEDPASLIEKQQVELADFKDKWMRAAAELENVRRRSQQEKENALKYGVSNFAKNLLAVADNLQRALDSVDDAARKENPTIDNILIGVDMTMRGLLDAFERQGIKPMEPLGQRFDPNVHEAMFEYEDKDKPVGMVGQVIETGYMIHDRALRPAKVGVTKGGSRPEPGPANEPLPTEDAAVASPGGEKPGTGTQDSEPGSHVDESL